MKSLFEHYQKRACVLILTAFAAESRSLCQHFGLRRRQDCSPWVVYASTDGHVVLLELGVGALKAATCMGMLSEYCRAFPHVMLLNIGSAGSSEYEMNTLLSVQQLCYAATGQSAYIRPVQGVGLQATCCLTVTQETTDYPSSGVVDMEATALVLAAEQFATREQWTVLKLVTDTPTSPPVRDKSKIQQAFKQQLTVIEQVVKQLITVSHDLCHDMPTSLLTEWRPQIHMTSTQQSQFNALLRDASLLLTADAQQQLLHKMQRAKSFAVLMNCMTSAMPDFSVESLTCRS